VVEKEDLFAAGGSFSQTGTPQFAADILYAHRVSAGLYSFTIVDIFAQSNAPDPAVPNAPKFTITTAPTTGVAQHVRDVGPVKLFVIATVGGAAGGTHVGWSYTTGGAAIIPVTKNFSAILNFRALKSSLGDVQGIYGVAIGWGK
jgi:hypothetical protein